MNARQWILLVDDDLEYCRAMQKIFEKRGYAVCLANDGHEALEAMSNQVFDLILSDLRMPDVNGIELMEEMRRRNVNVPVIFVTGYGEVESYMDLMNMGAFDYLNKPIDPTEIVRIVRKALEEDGSEAGVYWSRRFDGKSRRGK